MNCHPSRRFEYAYWQDAWAAVVDDRSAGGPRGAALVAAAVDLRRAGYHRPVPLDLLRELHADQLSGRGGAALRPESWEEGSAEP